MDIAVTDFPDPLSPTNATIFPFGMSIDAFVTAGISPSDVLNDTARFCIDNIGNVYHRMFISCIIFYGTSS